MMKKMNQKKEGRMRTAIIGAGIAGLAAGYRLKKSNVEAVIFEKESFAGGRMSSDYADGFIIDKGAYTIPRSHRFFLELGCDKMVALYI